MLRKNIFAFSEDSNSGLPHPLALARAGAGILCNTSRQLSLLFVEKNYHYKHT